MRQHVPWTPRHTRMLICAVPIVLFVLLLWPLERISKDHWRVTQVLNDWGLAMLEWVDA